MVIQRIRLQNFRSYRDVTIELQGKSVVVFGINGAGKTTILSAINYLFRPFVQRINQSQGNAYQSFSEMDVRIGSSTLQLSAEVEYDGQITNIGRIYSKSKAIKKARSQNTATEYSRMVGHLITDEIFNEDIPVFVNYGINRSVLDIPLRIRQTHVFDQKAAYEKAVESSISFRTFFEWFRYQEDIENEYIRQTGNMSYTDPQLNCVRHAVEMMLDDIKDLRVQRSPLCMKAKKGKSELRVEQLSDGEKCTLALFGDLARRLALANTEMTNPLEGRGIALIDEIDLHMHPEWQAKVLSTLKEVFPNIQFIITTHSPQVLFGVDDSYTVIRLNGIDDSDSRIDVLPRMDIYDSNTILASYMNANHNNIAYQQRIDTAFDMLDRCEYDEVRQMIEWLKSIDSNSPDLIRLESALNRRLYLDEKNRKTK